MTMIITILLVSKNKTTTAEVNDLWITTAATLDTLDTVCTLFVFFMKLHMYTGDDGIITLFLIPMDSGI